MAEVAILRDLLARKASAAEVARALEGVKELELSRAQCDETGGKC